MVDRLSFDTFLLERAVGMGAKTRLGERVKSISTKNELVQVQTDQETYFCKHLIGADGVHSIVAKQAGLFLKRSTSLAYEARLTRDRKQDSLLTDTITFDFGTISFGYGWIFPKRDHLNVGVCRTWPGKKASKENLLRFIDQHPALERDRIIDILAYPVPLGGRKTLLHKNKILLVGDAANLADPWLGEGLYYALFSGRLAAKTIIKHVNGNLEDLAEYTNQIEVHCLEQFRVAKRFSLLVNILPYFSVLLLKSSRTLQRMIIDLLRGEQSYQEIWRSLLTQAPERLIKKLRGNRLD
jgi:flavin-dependent dehydrogenase